MSLTHSEVSSSNNVGEGERLMRNYCVSELPQEEE